MAPKVRLTVQEVLVSQIGSPRNRAALLTSLPYPSMIIKHELDVTCWCDLVFHLLCSWFPEPEVSVVELRVGAILELLHLLNVLERTHQKRISKIKL